MTEETLWRAYVEKHPKWAEDDHIVKQKSIGLKRMIQSAFKQGQEQGLKQGLKEGQKKGYKTAYEMGKKKGASENPLGSLFGF